MVQLYERALQLYTPDTAHVRGPAILNSTTCKFYCARSAPAITHAAARALALAPRHLLPGSCCSLLPHTSSSLTLSTPPHGSRPRQRILTVRLLSVALPPAPN